MRVRIPFRHKVAVFAVIVDVAIFMLVYIILRYFISPEEFFSNEYNHLFFLVRAWGWLHYPIVLLPVSSSVFSSKGYNIAVLRGIIHLILCFCQTYVIFYVLGWLMEKKREKKLFKRDQ